jgi:hypothetical protein
MTKRDMKILMDELRAGSQYPGTDDSALRGIALRDFPFGKFIRKEAIVHFLVSQCMYMNGKIDEEELDRCFTLLYMKKVKMI